MRTVGNKRTPSDVFLKTNNRTGTLIMYRRVRTRKTDINANVDQPLSQDGHNSSIISHVNLGTLYTYHHKTISKGLTVLYQEYTQCPVSPSEVKALQTTEEHIVACRRDETHVTITTTNLE